MTDQASTPGASDLGAPRVELHGPASFYVTGEDHLRLRTFGSVASVVVALEGRFLDAAGRVVAFGERHVPASDRTQATTLHTLGEGWLLNAQLRASTGSPRRGQLFAILEVVRGRTGAVVPLATLLQGYVTDTSRLAWPGSAIRDSPEGPGVLRSITGTNPAAGAEVNETVPTNARWRLRSTLVSFVTSAVAGNRVPVLTINDGSADVVRAGLYTTIAASQTTIITWGSFGASYGPSATGVVTVFPSDVWLQGGWIVKTVTAGLDAGDNYAAPQLLVEEWIED